MRHSLPSIDFSDEDYLYLARLRISQEAHVIQSSRNKNITELDKKFKDNAIEYYHILCGMSLCRPWHYESENNPNLTFKRTGFSFKDIHNGAKVLGHKCFYQSTSENEVFPFPETISSYAIARSVNNMRTLCFSSSNKIDSNQVRNHSFLKEQFAKRPRAEDSCHRSYDSHNSSDVSEISFPLFLKGLSMEYRLTDHLASNLLLKHAKPELLREGILAYFLALKSDIDSHRQYLQALHDWRQNYQLLLEQEMRTLENRTISAEKNAEGMEASLNRH